MEAAIILNFLKLVYNELEDNDIFIILIINRIHNILGNIGWIMMMIFLIDRIKNKYFMKIMGWILI